jgi:hypothetical protein
VLLPFDPGHATLGGTPAQPIVRASAGFDWDANRCLLGTPTRLGLTDPELRKQLSRQTNAIDRLLLSIRRMGEGLLSLPDEVERFKEEAPKIVTRALNPPAAPTPRGRR